MSTVRNDRYDEISAIREHYKEREEELKAQHAKEKAKLSETYKSDVSELSDDYSERDDSRREDVRTTISSSNMKHTDDIQKMKTLHAKQIRELRDTGAQEENRYKKAFEENAERKDDMYRSKLEERERAHLKVLEVQSEEAAQATKRFHREHNNTVADIKSKYERNIAEASQRDTRAHQEELGAINKEYADYRNLKEREFKSNSRNEEFELENIEMKYQRLFEEQERKHENIVSNMREASIDGVNREKRQYMKGLEKEREAMMNSRQSMNENQTKRLDHLNYQIRQLKEQNVDDQQKMIRAKNREVENVKISYQDNIDRLEGQRSEMIKQNNEIRYNDVALANKRADDRIEDAYKYYHNKVQREADHGDANLSRLERRYQGESRQEQMMTDYRFKKVKDDYARDRAALQKHNNKVMGDAKENFDRTLQTERMERITERQKIRDHYETQIGQREVSHLEDMAKVKQNHQRAMGELRASYENQLGKIHEENERRLADTNRMKDADSERKQAAFDYRVKKMDEAYETRLKRLNINHEKNIGLLSQQQKGKAGKYA